MARPASHPCGPAGPVIGVKRPSLRPARNGALDRTQTASRDAVSDGSGGAKDPRASVTCPPVMLLEIPRLSL
jgi:hypothetical protein